MKKNEKHCLFLLPVDLHKKLKIKSAQAGKSMKQLIIEGIEHVTRK